MFDLSTLLSFTSASILLCLAPGPDNIFVLTLSSTHGRKAGLWVTLGICSGLIVHTLAVALGLAIIIQTSDIAFNLLKVAGALYLLYLAKGALTAPDQEIQKNIKSVSMSASLYKKGALLNITNPKVAVFFLAFLPQFVPNDSSDTTLALVLLGLIFMLIAGTVFGCIALLSGSIGQWLQIHPSAQSRLNKASGIVFIALALRLLLVGK